MATLKSVQVAAVDSGDRMADQRDDGNAHIKTFRVALTGAASLNDVILFGRLSVDTKIASIKIWSDDLGTTGDIDVGFHKVGDNNTAGDAVDVDAIADALDVNAAALAGTELRFSAKDINTADDHVWELAGLSERPDYGEVFLSATVVEATTAAGDIVIQVTTVD